VPTTRPTSPSSRSRSARNGASQDGHSPDHAGAPPAPITDPAEVARIAAAIAAAGSFALDLEFMTEGRYVAELSLVQVGWGDPAAPAVAAIDPLEVSVDPIIDLLTDPAVETVIHSAQADLALIGQEFDARAEHLVDTQIAAAFLGMGDQIGYAPLVQRVTGIELDKGAQFTEWSQRPLSPEQLTYALDDVRYLPRVWQALRDQLDARDRRAWVDDECVRLATAWSRRVPPDEMYMRVRGWNTLNLRQIGALRAVAAWRERESLEHNRPPSWLMNDRTMLELCRRPPRDERRIGDVRGMGSGIAQRYGRELLELIAAGMSDPPPAPPRAPRLPKVGQAWPAILSGIVQTRCRELEVAPRFVATRADIDDLIAWWLVGDHDAEPDLPLLTGWRRQLAGQDVLDWLAGRTTIAADDSEAGVRIAPS
jgi:ribonuclease D